MITGHYTCGGKGVAKKIKAYNGGAQQQEKSKLMTIVTTTSMMEEKGKSDLVVLGKSGLIFPQINKYTIYMNSTLNGNTR